MSIPALDSVQAYYDERIEGKIRDFTHANPRVEAAIQTLAEWAPSNPQRILEIGCGIGATSWRMARAWPQAEVIGIDISPASIEVARTCFQHPNLSYCVGVIKEGVLNGKFDLIVLMDVYEHISLHDRSSFHSVMKLLLLEEARVFLSFPTPALQNYARMQNLSGLQPVDEDVTLADVIRLAEETSTQLLYYREMGIWRYGDYAHLVLGRCQKLERVALRTPKPNGIAGLKQNLRNLLWGCQTVSTERYDYFGSDVLRPSPRNIASRFKVTARERQHLMSSWFRRSNRQAGSE